MTWTLHGPFHPGGPRTIQALYLHHQLVLVPDWPFTYGRQTRPRKGSCRYRAVTCAKAWPTYTPGTAPELDPTVLQVHHAPSSTLGSAQRIFLAGTTANLLLPPVAAPPGTEARSSCCHTRICHHFDPQPSGMTCESMVDRDVTPVGRSRLVVGAHPHPSLALPAILQCRVHLWASAV